MKRFITVWVLLMSFSLAAEAERFDWRSVVGDYDFISCHDNEDPLWGVNLENRYVMITEDSSNPMRNDLNIFLRRRDNSPLALNWYLPQIDQGTFYRRNHSTNDIYSAMEAFTNDSGLYSFKRWKSDTSEGWGQLQLSWLQDGNLQYTMLIHRSNSNEIQKETCILRRQN